MLPLTPPARFVFCFQLKKEAQNRIPRRQKSQVSLGTIARVLEHPGNKTLSLCGGFQSLPGVKATESSGFMERAMGIEPTSEAWEASILPLYDARSFL
jgi:hypothetical protein